MTRVWPKFLTKNIKWKSLQIYRHEHNLTFQDFLILTFEIFF
jgi:hypothetical protein